MSGAISENVECPSCKEKVPKTLYCLSCGYPIYKMDEAETPTTEVKADAVDSQPVEESIKAVEIEVVKPEEIAVETKSEELNSIQSEQLIDTPPTEPVLEEILNEEESKEKEPIPEVNVDSYPIEKAVSEPVIEVSQEVTPIEAPESEPVESPIQTKLDENPALEAQKLESIKEGEISLDVKVAGSELSPGEPKQNDVDVTPEIEPKLEMGDSAHTESVIETPLEMVSDAVFIADPIEAPNQPNFDENEIEKSETLTEEVVGELEPLAKEQVIIVEEATLEPVIEEPKLIVEEVAPEPIETPLTSRPDVLTFSSPVDSNVEIQSIGKDTPMIEAKTINYIPDSYCRDVVEHLTRSTALKLKLIKHYREGNIKEETFTKLFNNITQDETNWNTRYNEITHEATEKISEAKIAHQTAEEAHELIEVRHAIGDASEEEYSVKLPALKWDLDHCDRVISERMGKLAYLEGLGGVLGDVELGVLRGLAGVQFNTVDALGVESEELFSRVKESLYRSVKLLG